MANVLGCGHLVPTIQAWAARRSVQPSSGQSGRIFTYMNVLHLNIQPVHQNGPPYAGFRKISALGETIHPRPPMGTTIAEFPHK